MFRKKQVPGENYSPNGRFLLQETFPKTLFVFILISLQRWQHRAHNENQPFCVDWSISRDLLGADICEELPELSETDAEREYRGTSPLCSGE